MYAVSGLVVGFVVGMTGVGGGSLMTPLLVFLFGVPVATAVGTDLLYAAITKTFGAWSHWRLGTVQWPIVRRMLAGSLPAALATLGAMHALAPAPEALEPLILGCLGAALVVTAAVLAGTPWLRRLAPPDYRLRRCHVLRGRAQAVLTVLAGVLVGVLVTLTSVGAGALGTAALLFLYPGLPLAAIVGTELLHAVPLAALAGLGHLQLGHLDLLLLANLLAGSLPGVWLGAKAGAALPEGFTRMALASLLLVLGLRLVP